MRNRPEVSGPNPGEALDGAIDDPYESGTSA